MSSKHYALTAETRDQAGKGAARSLRREGKTPAVIYGDKKEPLKITLDANTVNVIYNKGHMFTTLCDLSVSNDKFLVLARDVQLHPVTDIVEHIDFLRVTDKTRIMVKVPVHFINEEQSPGLEAKGILNIVRHEVEVHCRANAIPEIINVDLAGKGLGDSVHSSDAKYPDGVTPVIDDRDFTIATIVAPRTMEEIEAAEADTDDGIEREGEEAEGEGKEEAEKSEGGDE